MRAIEISAPNEWRLVDLPDPRPAPGEVVVGVAWCGICGTDQHILAGGFRADYPLIPGHEFTGSVVEVGPDVEGWIPGDRVAVDPNIVCGRCPYCRRGEVHLCQALTAVGVNRPGGFAERCCVPATQLHRLPPGVRFGQGALSEPLACVVHGLDRAALRAGERAVVIGTGPIGLLMVQLLRQAGAAWIGVSEPIGTRRVQALELGADAAWDPRVEDSAAAVRRATKIGADVVVECVGRPEAVTAALACARRGGRVVLFGVAEREAEVPLRPYDVFLNELTLIGSYINPFTQARALDLLAGRRINTDAIISDRFPLAEFGEALATAASGKGYKVLVGG